MLEIACRQLELWVLCTRSLAYFARFRDRSHFGPAGYRIYANRSIASDGLVQYASHDGVAGKERAIVTLEELLRLTNHRW